MPSLLQQKLGTAWWSISSLLIRSMILGSELHLKSFLSNLEQLLKIHIWKGISRMQPAELLKS